ncbi:MAG: hypothetical protein H0W59_08390, partial [Chloroflexia bacterium]|nr:hypothetical protein [Chloroflexia bacterium]
MRPLIAMVDSHLCALAEFDPRVRLLLELLAVDPIQTHLYADNGAPHRLPRQVIKEIEYVSGWINTIAADDSFLEVTYFKDGKPDRRRSRKNMSAYQHVHPTDPVDELALDAQSRRQLELDAMAMLAAATIQADLFIT